MIGKGEEMVVVVVEVDTQICLYIFTDVTVLQAILSHLLFIFYFQFFFFSHLSTFSIFFPKAEANRTANCLLSRFKVGWTSLICLFSL